MKIWTGLKISEAGTDNKGAGLSGCVPSRPTPRLTYLSETNSLVICDFAMGCVGFMWRGALRNFVHVETLILRIAFCNPGNLASTLRTLISALRFSSEGPSSESRGSTHTQRSGVFNCVPDI
jgi:hypothetical protein